MFLGTVLGLLLGLSAGAVAFLGYRYWIAARASRVGIFSSVESLKAVGELVALKLFTQQIVTAREHMLGDWGEKWLAWLISSKKTAMIFDFVVDFRYDLRSAQFVPRLAGNGVEFNMPPCYYEIQLKNIRIYDERAAAFARLLLPEWIGQIFGGRFTEDDKNRLIAAARTEAERLAGQLAGQYMKDVQRSAEATLRQMAAGMGFRESRFQFDEHGLRRGAVDLSAIEKAATAAVVATKA
jgi:hypothetical protein